MKRTALLVMTHKKRLFRGGLFPLWEHTRYIETITEGHKRHAQANDITIVLISSHVAVVSLDVAPFFNP